MTCGASVDDEALLDVVLGTLAPAERESVAVYVLDGAQPAGTELSLGTSVIRRTRELFVFFIDREPAANWAHACRYVLLTKTGEPIEILDARMPPDVRGDAARWRVVWRGREVPEWAVEGHDFRFA